MGGGRRERGSGVPGPGPGLGLVCALFAALCHLGERTRSTGKGGRRARDNFNFEIFHPDPTPSVVVTTVLILVSAGVEGRDGGTCAGVVVVW